ncbi:MAG TPA: response regulator [Bacteroidia bacterium]|nr:response regulator [Bacteroidia bacterium]
METVIELPIKILYVEDDEIDQKAFQRYIKNGDFNLQYELASSVKDAKDLIENNEYDVIVTDYLLKAETGFSIIDMAKDVPVIFITGQGDQQVAVKAMKKGAFDYIVKESSGHYLDLLTTTIEKAFSYSNTHKKLEEAEQEIKKLLWALGQINNSITILDKEGNVEWVNKGFENLFGYALEEVKNKSACELRRNDISRSKLENFFSREFRNKNILTCESQIISNKEEKRWIYTTMTPIKDDAGNLVRIIIVDTDISEKKKIEQELIKAKEEAEDAAVAKQQFLANMSHEIRTPINGIMGMMHMLENTEHAETRKKYLQLVNYASNNLLNIINDILDMSKLEFGKMVIEKHEFNLPELVFGIKKSMQYQAEGKGLQLNCNIDNHVPSHVYGDSARLNQILINLVGNAIKFTEKGNITISVTTNKKSENKAQILFTVSDTGIGIEKKHQCHIFEYFHQVNSDTTRQYGGTGLGLAIVKRLAEIQGGKAWFTSVENKGSDFFVQMEFEIGRAHKKIEAQKATNLEGFFLKGKKILLVEDETLNQMVAKYLLENELGAQVEIASNGEMAIEMLEKSNFDLVIMDIQMPKMNGYDTAHYIRTKLPEPQNKTLILAMTAHAFKDEEIKCKEAGMNDFISKPIKIDELKQKLQLLLT